MAAPSPLVAAALLAVAGIAATYLSPARRLARAARPLPLPAAVSWYAVGIVLGPVLGLLDQRLLADATPAMVLAAVWIAARAGREVVMPAERTGRGRGTAFLDALAAWLGPAAALYAASRFLPGNLAPAWDPRLPVIAALAAAVSLAAGADRRFSALVGLCALLGALIAPLPHDKLLRLPRQVAWGAIGLAGIGLTAVLWGWIARRAPLPPSAAVAGLAIGAGIGLATGLSPLVVCALAAAARARRSLPHAPEGWAHFARSDAPAAAILWVAAGAQFGGDAASLAIATLALSLWPLARRLAVRGAGVPERTLGLVLVFSYVWTTGRAGAEPLVTAVALALLLTELPAPRAARGRLTSGLARVEVSA